MTPELSQAYAAAEIATEKVARLTERVRELEAALEQIANGDPSQVYSPIGPLHAAGIVCQWEIDAAIARAALAKREGG